MSILALILAAFSGLGGFLGWFQGSRDNVRWFQATALFLIAAALWR